MGVVSPLGNELDAFWNALIESKCGVDKIKAFDASGFDTQIAAEVKNFDPTPAFPSPKEIRRTDRFSQYGVYAAWKAIQDSGLDLAKANTDEIGVFIGSGIGGLQTTAEQHKTLLDRGPGTPFAVHDSDADFEHGIGIDFDVLQPARVPNFATCSACATANHALGEAWRTLKMGDAKVMLAGGAEATILPIGIGGFCAMRAMSTRNDDPQHASRPFDKERDGFVMGEGAGDPGHRGLRTRPCTRCSYLRRTGGAMATLRMRII
jgi:3-oxoacyl-[acyl-carrier-protein] synthase II